MSEPEKINESERKEGTDVSGHSNWGPKLFVGVLIGILLFFYWLLIYSGGVTVHHG